MISQSQLLSGLEDYARCGKRHVALVNEEFVRLQQSWSALDAVYDGRAAEEFRDVWQGVTEAMRDYSESTASILRMLEGRIESLRQADSPDGLGRR